MSRVSVLFGSQILKTLKQTTSYHRSSFFNRFSTSSSKQAIPPIVWILKPITRMGAILAGNGFREWWAALPHLKRELFKSHLLRNKFRYMTGVGGSSAACFVFYRYHLEETPITKRQRFMLFSSEQLTEIEKVEKKKVTIRAFIFYFFHFIVKFNLFAFEDFKNIRTKYS
jgi:hypothetical protein